MDNTPINTTCDVAKIGMVDFTKEHIVEIAGIAISAGIVGFLAGNRGSNKKKGLSDVIKPEWSDDIKKRIRQKEDYLDAWYNEFEEFDKKLFVDLVRMHFPQFGDGGWDTTCYLAALNLPNEYERCLDVQIEVLTKVLWLSYPDYKDKGVGLEDGNNDKYYELSRLLNRLEAVIPRNKWDDYLRAVRKNNR
ncbi:MAG: hypothetical protein LBO69_06705, partial [Ignavibacteria bacterium]|nr:hypothetical protein [Ignavibacteria bacterium]